MRDFLLNLEDGQTMRILPFNEDALFMSYGFYYNSNITPFILDVDSPIKLKSDIMRTIRIFYLVEYMGKFQIIQTGRSIKRKIDEYFTANGLTSFNPQHLIDYPVYLNIKLERRSSFPDYGNSSVYQSLSDSGSDTIELFDTQEYKDIMSDFYNYINRLKLEHNPKTIKYLDENNFIEGNYNYLLRNIKINEIRKKKISTTKTLLWNQVISVIADADQNSESIEDIGYSEEDNLHQFTVDGYLFEIKLIDEI